ncbi:ATP-binding protein [Rhodoferax antarcticus]|uniref:Putative magnesium chelatase, subunit ChlI family protein n=1 Tax=Rhodoferax antarcticus ANT.BR TaxID=1111071 RepID=A0A1Q8YH29_9BURK|nr:ATP-binding protein [Rhodoferax antarcticus]APW45349.1 magnesium chelatase [Rhodoferax antarcticus]MCW2311178.1 magnesium chelatase subunit I [Rhodoferax antarcticus]OLP07229.1 putative magnesium chelatase, subunit ChlI family protein [Rhodoferax antarcticus ANT.BR]
MTELMATRPKVFPFTALVGQQTLQRALLLVAIDPGIGGVLISGPRGTAKSTAARALADLLPQAPFVTLPLAASLEQLVGTLNVEDVLRDGQLRLAPGLVARAHHGVLYVDEVNLLPDALVDALLDVAASGVNTVERDGISQQHAARFVLVGTMNPEEGELRPQLLDRFGLLVALENQRDPTERQAILQVRLAFDDAPQALHASHAEALQNLAVQVATARAALPRLAWSDAVLARAAQWALSAGVDGVRADLVMLRAARAWAALQGRQAVTVEDVDVVAELALAHRRTDASSGGGAPHQASGPDGAAKPSPPRAPSEKQSDSSGSPSSATPQPRGDWGALPPQPVATTRVHTVAGWPAKKA